VDYYQPGKDRYREVWAMRFLSNDASARIDRVLAATTENFVELVHIAGLSPANDFRYKHLRGIDFGSSELVAFDFTGTIFDACKFEAASFKGATLDEVEFRNCDPRTSVDWHLADPAVAALPKDRFGSGNGASAKAEGIPIHELGQRVDEVADAAETHPNDLVEPPLEVVEDIPGSELAEPPSDSFFRNWLGGRRNEMALSLGTTNTLIYRRGRGIVLNEPSSVAIEMRNGVNRIIAIGKDAELLAGKTPEMIELVRPIYRGVIADIEVAERMVEHLLRKVFVRSLLARGPRVLVSVPSGATGAERRVIRDAIAQAGAREVWLIEEPLAAAIGAGLPVSEPVGSMVVAIGSGATEVAVPALLGLAYTTSVRVGGVEMDEAISSYLRRQHNLIIGEATAERIKKQVGMAKPPVDGVGLKVIITGRDLVNGVPKQVEINQRQIAEALAESVATIIEGVRIAFENTAPELAADIVDRGIVLTGGGSLLQGLAEVLSEETGLSVTLAKNPETCVISGMARVLDDPTYRVMLSHGG
jgi:rod shape-determining protein MreB